MHKISRHWDFHLSMLAGIWCSAFTVINVQAALKTAAQIYAYALCWPELKSLPEDPWANFLWKEGLQWIGCCLLQPYVLCAARFLDPHCATQGIRLLSWWMGHSMADPQPLTPSTLTAMTTPSSLVGWFTFRVKTPNLEAYITYFAPVHEKRGAHPAITCLLCAGISKGLYTKTFINLRNAFCTAIHWPSIRPLLSTCTSLQVEYKWLFPFCRSIHPGAHRISCIPGYTLSYPIFHARFFHWGTGIVSDGISW